MSKLKVSPRPTTGQAPAVYRPFAATPQLKPAGNPQVYRPAAGAQPGVTAQMKPGVGAPPVYRPFATTPQLKPAGATQVYRPTAGAQPGMTAQMKPGAGAPPVYQPESTATQAKDARKPQKMQRPTRPPLPTQNAAIQRVVTLTKTGKIHQISGRPVFTSHLQTATFTKADDDGEEYITKHSLNGKTFTLPTLHRRHKLAWALWMEVVNRLLKYGDHKQFTEWIQQTILTHNYEFTKPQFERARLEGKNLLQMANEFFNEPKNVWIGPGDENIQIGAGLGKLISKYKKKKSAGNRAALVAAAFDPHNKKNITWNDETLENESTPIPNTPISKEFGEAVETGVGLIDILASPEPAPKPNVYATPKVERKTKK